MKQRHSLPVITFILIFFSVNLKAQNFNLIKTGNYQKSNLIFDTLENSIPKVVFIYDNPILLYNKGLPASDVLIKKGTVTNLVGFSEKTYDLTYNQEKYNLPYQKIRYNGTSYWTYSIFPFIFDDAHPDISFISQDVKYNVYSCKNIKFFDNEKYSGYEIIIVKNTETNTYKLITCYNYPDVLKGHTYGNEFVYLQNDEKESEKIVGINNEKNLANLKIRTNYQKGAATYTLTFTVTDATPEAKYWGIRLEQ